MGTSDAGLLELFVLAPGCTEKYDGEFAEERIFIVGRGSDSERLFRADQLAAASEYSRVNRAGIAVSVASQLCKAAVEALIAGGP